MSRWSSSAATLCAALSFLQALVPGIADAGDVHIMSGFACHEVPTIATGKVAGTWGWKSNGTTEAPFAYNFGTTDITVVCPISRDFTGNSNGIIAASLTHMQVSSHGVTCAFIAADTTGAVKTSFTQMSDDTFAVTDSHGVSLASVPNGEYYFKCTVGNGAGIRSYRFEEKGID